MNNKENNQKITTIDELAGMINNSFQTAKEHSDKRFDKIDFRLDKIENLILTDHKTRIENLEVEVKQLKDLLAFK